MLYSIWQTCVLHYLRDKVLIYLDTSCHNTTSLQSALQKDLRNDKLLLQLQAFGIIGKLVIGPWIHASKTTRP